MATENKEKEFLFLSEGNRQASDSESRETKYFKPESGGQTRHVPLEQRSFLSFNESNSVRRSI